MQQDHRHLGLSLQRVAEGLQNLRMLKVSLGSLHSQAKHSHLFFWSPHPTMHAKS